MMINDGTMPVFFAAGALVVNGRLIDSDVTPSYVNRPFDPGEAAKDPFGVGSVTPQEIRNAIFDAMQSRLDDHSGL